MRPLRFLLFFGIAGLTAASGQETAFSTRAETGFFNKAYQDRQYASPAPVTFSVPYIALGFEGRHRDDQGNVIGVDAAQTTIGEGKVLNVGQWEIQPLTVLTYASIFVGKDWGWWESDVGVGALVQFQDYSPDPYLLADGTTSGGRAAGLDWNRRESFTLITGLFRLFPELGPHLKLRLARGELSLTEDLFNVQGVVPFDWGRFDAELSFSSPQGYWFGGPGILRNNERLSFGLAWGKALRAGFRLGFLLRPMVGGTGDVDLLHRLSFGFDLGLGWPGS